MARSRIGQEAAKPKPEKWWQDSRLLILLLTAAVLLSAWGNFRQAGEAGSARKDRKVEVAHLETRIETLTTQITQLNHQSDKNFTALQILLHQRDDLARELARLGGNPEIIIRKSDQGSPSSGPKPTPSPEPGRKPGKKPPGKPKPTPSPTSTTLVDRVCELVPVLC